MPTRTTRTAGPMSRRAAWMTLALVAVVPGSMSRAREPESASVPVRFAEGTVHGFLELTTESGELLAHGDLLQVAKDNATSSRMVFHFDKGSVFEESVTYTQRGVFTMETYHLVQSGPAFASDLDAMISRSGDYEVKTRSHKDGKETAYTGRIDLPGDVYNGMVITIAKNVSTKDVSTVHVVAFTPEPRVVKLVLAPSGAERVRIGAHGETAVTFALKIKLEGLLYFAAKLAGRIPPDSHVWIITEDVPAFVRSEGPLYEGPIWRIALTSPDRAP